MSPPRTITRADRLIDGALWLASALFAGSTLAFSLVIAPPEVSAFTPSDKALHVIAYFATGLSLLLAGVWRPGRGDGPFAEWRLRGAFAMLAVGASIEIVQAVFTARQAELGDIAADAIGVGGALLAHALIRRATGG